ncbi:MAG: hypothetical protein JWO22_589 [Frankiales bacterium]|nr:hypothetical protein [Frankiales bacterium]
MNPLGTRARAEELAALLDGAVAGPGSLTAPHAGLAARLLTLAPTLQSLATPRPEFRDALRQRLVAVATVQAANAPAYAEPLNRPRALDAAVSWSQSRKAQRRIGVTAGAMASVVALTGIGVAATRSLPGQAFYGVKRFGEGIQLDLASGDQAKGSKHLEFAATRLREVKALAHGDGSLSLGAPGHPTAAGIAFGGSTSSNIAMALADFDSETKAGTTLLKNVYDKTGRPAPLRIITSFTHEQTTRLAALLPALPASVKPQAQSSLDLVTAAQSDATDLLALGTCNGSCYPGNAGPPTPTQPVPAPGATATPTDPTGDNNGVPNCNCGQPTLAPSPTSNPEPTPSETPSQTPSDEPTQEPTTEPSPSDSPSPTPDPTLLPVPLPTLPVPVPTLPVPVPTLPTAPALPLLATGLPGLPKS